MLISPTIAVQVDARGFAMVDPGASLPWCDSVVAAIASPDPPDERRRGGVRDLLGNSPALVPLLGGSIVWQVAESILGPDCFIVRSLLFDKTPRANWKVAWHQDRSIAVRERIDVAGFEPWSRKDGAVHVQPPVDVLEGMLIARVHLDDCDEDNGPRRVIHLEFAASSLPGGLEWRDRVGNGGSSPSRSGGAAHG